MTHDKVKDDYFEWLFDTVCEQRFSKQISYRKLLMYLHNKKFRYSIPNDLNRAKDGKDLRYRFALILGYRDDPDYILDILKGSCSVLEMMVALAIRCEEAWMDDPSIGNRIGQWFWDMIKNLGLRTVTDDRFDRDYVESVINRFLNREYEPNGRGGLFTIHNCNRDLRDVEIWYQLSWYLDSIV